MRNKDKADCDKEEDGGSPLASIEDGYPSNKYDGGCEDDQEDDGIYDPEYTALYNAKEDEEKYSSGHKGESSSSYLLESSDNKYEDDDETGAKDINCDGNGNGRGDRNNGTGRGSAEWIGFLSPSARTEALGALKKS